MAVKVTKSKEQKKLEAFRAESKAKLAEKRRNSIKGKTVSKRKGLSIRGKAVDELSFNERVRKNLTGSKKGTLLVAESQDRKARKSTAVVKRKPTPPTTPKRKPSPKPDRSVPKRTAAKVKGRNTTSISAKSSKVNPTKAKKRVNRVEKERNERFKDKG